MHEPSEMCTENMLTLATVSQLGVQGVKDKMKDIHVKPSTETTQSLFTLGWDLWLQLYKTGSKVIGGSIL